MVICYGSPRKLTQNDWQICFSGPASYSSQVSFRGHNVSSDKWFDNRETELGILIWKPENVKGPLVWKLENVKGPLNWPFGWWLLCSCCGIGPKNQTISWNCLTLRLASSFNFFCDPTLNNSFNIRFLVGKPELYHQLLYSSIGQKDWVVCI